MRLPTVLLISLLLFGAGVGFAAENDHAALRKRAQKYYNNGNYKDALELLQRLCLEVENDPRLVGGDLSMAWQSLQQLNRLSELDRFREAVVARHGGNWRLLLAAAQSYAGNQHWGHMIAGEFERGGHRGGGKYVNAIQRDRVRALQLMQQAMAPAEDDPAAAEVARFYLSFGRMIHQFHGQSRSWRLHALTDLDALPDYEPGYGYGYDRPPLGASVDSEGRPIYHRLPRDWASAVTDGERWRWVLQRAVQLIPELTPWVLNACASCF